MEQFLDLPTDLGGREGFRKESVSAAAEADLGGVIPTVPADDHYGNEAMGGMLSHPLNQLESMALGKVQVGDDEGHLTVESQPAAGMLDVRHDVNG